MTIGTNDAVVKRGTAVILEGTGASIGNNTIYQATTATYSVDADGDGAPDGIFRAALAFGSAPTENATVDIIAQALDVDGAGLGHDAPAPTSTYRHLRVGGFTVKATTGTQYLECAVTDLPKNARYWLYNNNTGQTIGSGWALSIEPATFGPHA